MSELLINRYQAEIAKYIQYGGDKKETSIRRAFANLLTSYCKPHDLLLVDELEFTTKLNTRVVPDGTIKDALRLTHGYWEAKDESDDIDVEIEKKLKKGYPADNILFEDSITAVLLQNNMQVMRVNMKDATALDKLVRRFVEFERPELQTFRQAITQFKQDMPEVLNALRELITSQAKINVHFKTALSTFLKLCQDNINADIVIDDAREMLIQHILTEDIFNTVFGDTQFHRENNIARELQTVADGFFNGSTKKNTLKRLESYYGAIKQSASGISNHHEKQKFLKAIYENFYKVYNPKLADRLGVVYTPNEIVRFMIESTEALVHQHFGKLLINRGVEILDPATGTGTFITDLIEHFKHNKEELKYKYQNELHCNEVAILPYYIANLNIEFTYSQIMNEYVEFPHICFVDTLDNLGFQQTHKGGKSATGNLFDIAMTAVNTERVKEQNLKKISVIIGNPPYNANQLNENENNKNRTYEGIDERIKSTYIKESTAQKTKLYDMYARFLRWASDRLDENGVVAFITNRSFIDSRTFDGFRKIVAQEFNEVCIVDLGGDVRANPKLSGTMHNVFGIQTGVAISFLVKNAKQQGCKIRYLRRPEMETAEEKLSYLASNQLNSLSFLAITPDKNHNWINLSDNDFESLIPLVSKEAKGLKIEGQATTLLKTYSLGVCTARDEWVYDFGEKELAKKIKFFCDVYESERERWNRSKRTVAINNFVSREIKWTEELESHLKKGTELSFSLDKVRRANYRPFVKCFTYYSDAITHRRYQTHLLFPTKQKNPCIVVMGDSSGKPYFSLALDELLDLNFVSPASGGSQTLPFYIHDENGNRVENFTDWGLAQFVTHYGTLSQPITKQAIFHYIYAVLHDPIYREKYALNLKREFPRVPFYANFWLWSNWGEYLMQTHIAYESAEPFALARANVKVPKPKAKLKADKVKGEIIIDEATSLSGIPSIAWEYKLGNRSAIEWVLDQYKETKPKDPTIREKFNSYQFANYKEHVIDLICKVCTVSVTTQTIVNEMKNLDRN